MPNRATRLADVKIPDEYRLKLPKATTGGSLVQTEFLNLGIKNQVYLEQYSEHLREKVVKILEKAQTEIVKSLMENDPTVMPLTEWKKKRLSNLNARIGEILEDHYQKVGDLTKAEMVKLASFQKDYTVASANRVFGVNLFDVHLTPENLEAIATQTMIQGQVIGKWWAEKPEIYRQKMEKAINQGMQQIELGLVKGEAVGELIRRIRGYKSGTGFYHPGVMDVAYNEAASLVRTSVMQVAQTVRRSIYEANEDVIEGIQVVATLDTRTTPLCRGLDGRQFHHDGSAMDGGRPMPPGPPFHWQCRSTIVPIVRPYSDLVKGKGKISKDKLDELEKMDAGTRASMNGQVPATLDYNEWLKTQPKSVQVEVLGEPRWKLWQTGKLTMADMVHQDGRPLSIDELQQKIAAFDSKKVYELAMKEIMEKFEDPNLVAVFQYGQEVPAAFKPVESLESLKYQTKELDVPEMVVKPGKKVSSGVIMFEPETGKVWIYEPKGHFGGYEHTFPKGILEAGGTLQKTAIREVWEETGLQARIVGYLGDYEKTTSVTRYYVGVRTAGVPAMIGDETASVKLVPQNKLKSMLNVDVDRKIADDFIARYAEALEAGAGDAVKGFEIMADEKVYEKKISELSAKHPGLVKEVAPLMEEIPLAQMSNKQAYEAWMQQLKAKAASDVNSWLLDKELQPIVNGIKTKDPLEKWEQVKAAVEEKLAAEKSFFKNIPRGSAEWDAWQDLKRDPAFEGLDLSGKIAMVKKNAHALNTVAEMKIPDLSGFRKFVYDVVPEGKYPDIHSKMKFVGEETAKQQAAIIKTLKENGYKIEWMDSVEQQYLISKYMGNYVDWLKQELPNKIVSWDDYFAVMNKKYQEKILSYKEMPWSMEYQAWKEYEALYPEYQDQAWFFKVPQYESMMADLVKTVDEWQGLIDNPYWDDALKKAKADGVDLSAMPKKKANDLMKGYIEQYKNASDWKENMAKLFAPDTMEAEVFEVMKGAGVTDLLDQKKLFGSYLKRVESSYQQKFDSMMKPFLEKPKYHASLKLQPDFWQVGNMDLKKKVAWLEQNAPGVLKYVQEYEALVADAVGKQTEKALKASVEGWEKKPIKEKYDLLKSHVEAVPKSVVPVEETALAQSPVGQQAISDIKQIYGVQWETEWDEAHKMEVLKKHVDKMNNEAGAWLGKEPPEKLMKVMQDLQKQYEGFDEKSIWEIKKLYQEKAKSILDNYNDYALMTNANPGFEEMAKDAVGADAWAKMPIEDKVFHLHVASTISGEAAAAAMETVSVVAKAEPLTGTVKLGTKTFDLSDPAQLANFKKNQSDALSKYKKAVLQGKAPTAQQKEAYELLSEKDKELFDLKIEKEQGKFKQAAAKASEVKPVEPAGDLNFDDFTQYGEQKGSNEGGFYQSRTNPAERYYFKFPANEEIARNEVLAGKLYQAAGVEVPEITFVARRGEKGVASRIIDGIKADAKALQAGRIAGAQENFVVDAWLGDWDVVGLNYDNLVLKEGRTVRIDVGGSLRFRAQGGLKAASDFGPQVSELKSMLNPRTNRQAASVFKHATREDLVAGARKVLAVSDDEIRVLVAKYGPMDGNEAKKLADTLIARKKHIAEMFPEAKTVTRVAPPKDIGDVVSDMELRKIREARVNGYAIRFDKDEIEDQQILFWTQKNKKGETQIACQFKARFKGADKLNEVTQAKKHAGIPSTSQAVVKGLQPGSKDLESSLNGSFYQALRGIASCSRTNVPLRAKDIDRAKAAQKKWEEYASKFRKGIAEGKFRAADLEKWEKAIEPWRKVIDDVINAGQGNYYKWANDTTWKNDWKDLEFIEEIVKKAKVIEKPPEDMVFVKREGKFEEKQLDKGWAQETGNSIYLKDAGMQFEYYLEAEVDNCRVRYWPDVENIALANRGKVEIVTVGDGKQDIQRIVNVIEKLKVNAARATALDAEELYIRQIVYSMGPPNAPLYADFLKGSGEIADQEKRVQWMRDFMNKVAGKDVTKSPTYNPMGEYEAFQNGRFFTYRPDLEGAEWNKFKKDYRIYHYDTSGRALSDTVDSILNSGGCMAPSADKVRRGFSWGGMSPVPDMASGGGSFFFTRIRKTQNVYRSTGFVWRADILARTDAWSYPDDFFGNMVEDWMTRQRGCSIEKWKQYAGNTKNETVFKNSLSFFDHMEAIVAPDALQREKIIEIFKKHGYNDVNGVKLEDFVKVKK